MVTNERIKELIVDWLKKQNKDDVFCYSASKEKSVFTYGDVLYAIENNMPSSDSTLNLVDRMMKYIDLFHKNDDITEDFIINNFLSD